MTADIQFPLIPAEPLDLRQQKDGVRQQLAALAQTPDKPVTVGLTMAFEQGVFAG